MPQPKMEQDVVYSRANPFLEGGAPEPQEATASPRSLDLARQLARLFPSHPDRHIRLTHIDGGRKEVTTVKGAAGLADYARHVSSDAYSGVGALGVIPGQRGEELTSGKYRWQTSFLALDFDTIKPLELQELLDSLWSMGIYAYPSCGTTGRGSHLYIFLDKALSMPEAYDCARSVAAYASQMGISGAELRPSTGYGRGMGIFIPYRGLEMNDLGYNYLLDPEHDLLPIHLEATEWLSEELE